MISGVFTLDSAHLMGTPLSAYGGRPMWSGTGRRGLTMPCITRPSSGLWQRLYLRPLPHQHASLACGRVDGGWAFCNIGFSVTRRQCGEALA